MQNNDGFIKRCTPKGIRGSRKRRPGGTRRLMSQHRILGKCKRRHKVVTTDVQYPWPVAPNRKWVTETTLIRGSRTPPFSRGCKPSRATACATS